MARLRIMTVFGTRPEAIKLAPVIKRIEKYPGTLEGVVVTTSQHREMLDQALHLFGIRPHCDLNIMTSNQNLIDVAARVLQGLRVVVRDVRPDVILVQGDTTTTFASSLVASYCRVRLGHVEAGLRTRDKFNPFPEEVNRRLTSVVADYHFAPTEGARQNLLREGITKGDIFVTGNTAIDALLMVLKGKGSRNRLSPSLADCVRAGKRRSSQQKLILVTAHRRESFGKPMADIMLALRRLVELNPQIRIVFPVHYNPNVRRVATKALAGCDRVLLTDPLDYGTFVQLMSASYLILTDSGGIQEEAPSLGKPVLVMRETSERPEGIEAGTAKLVGRNPHKIVESVMRLIRDRAEYRKMARAVNPYGDGRASQRIVRILIERELGRAT